MKKILFIIFSVMVVLASYSQPVSITRKAVFHNQESFPFHPGYAASYSFSAFEMINDEQAAFLCNTDKQIRILNKNTSAVSKIIDLPFIPQDFRYADSRFYILSDRNLVVTDENGEIQQTHPVNHIKDIVTGMEIIKGSIYLITSAQQSFCINCAEKSAKDGIILEENLFGKTMRLNDQEFKITLSEDEEIYSNTFFSEKKIGAVVLAGKTGNHIYIDIEFITQEIPLKTRRQIRVYEFKNRDIDLKSTINLPDVYYSYVKKDIAITENGAFHVVHAPEAVQLFKISGKRKSGEIVTAYPAELMSGSYHFNNHTLEAPPEEGISMTFEKKAESTITRDQILQNAAPFLEHVWVADSMNIQDTACGGKNILTPDWVAADTNYFFPYMWGGWSTIAEFDTGLAEGKSVGDIDTQAGFGAPDCAVGHDCSGFVSRVWELSWKRNTTGLTSISTQYGSFTELKPGDIVDWAGHHVRLVDTNQANGTVDCIEATKGYDEWRILRRNYTYTDLQGDSYLPLYYNNVLSVPETPVVHQDINCYPNPFSEALTIELIRGMSGKSGKIEIYDIAGKILFDEIFEYPETQIHLQLPELKPGIYFVRIAYGETVRMRKICKSE